MNKLKTLSFVFLILIFSASCTEEISDELKNTDQSAVANNATKAVGKKMKLTHTMDDNLSYHMHSVKGRDYPCELEASGLNFSSTTYEKSDSKDVADCILEVEELDLYFEGVKFELEVDEYLCEYVHYKPFKYFKYPVGYTVQNQYEVKCDSSCSGASDASSLFCANIEGTYLTYDGGAKLSTTASTGGQFSNASSGSCKFDYTDSDGPNCDPGKISTQVYQIFPEYNDECISSEGNSNVMARTNSSDCETAGTWTLPGDPSGSCTGYPSRLDETNCLAVGEWGPVAYCGLTDVAGTGYDNNIIYDSEGDTVDECGGSAYECLDGPALEHLSGPEYSGEIYDNKDLDSFTKEWTIASSISKTRSSNRYIANYSRICSNNQTKASYYDNVLTSATGLIGSEVETHTPSPKSPYDATDPTQVYQKEYVDYNNDGNDDYIVYADHPFLGVTEYNSRARTTVMPYYAFNCLDKARDVKAQIRLYIREWDRMFDSDDAKMEYVSDFDDPSSSSRLIDNDGYYDDDHAWNNFKDWDDHFDGKFTGDKCGALVNETNPGQCYKETGDTQGTCTGGTKEWVAKKAKCFDYNAGSLQTGKAACEAEANDQMWFWGMTASSFIYNFPWSSI